MMICVIIEPNERYFLTSENVYTNIIMNNNIIIIIFLATQPCDSVAMYLHASTANLYSLRALKDYYTFYRGIAY